MENAFELWKNGWKWAFMSGKMPIYQKHFPGKMPGKMGIYVWKNAQLPKAFTWKMAGIMSIYAGKWLENKHLCWKIAGN